MGEKKREGYLPAIVFDGRTALARVEKDPPDMVILDLMLPDMDGLEVLRRLRDSRVQTPVLILSGLTESEMENLSDIFQTSEQKSEAKVIIRINVK